MLVDFYAPSLRPDLDAIEKKWAELLRAISEIILLEPKTQEKVGELLVTLAESSASISRASEAAKLKLNELVKGYVSRV